MQQLYRVKKSEEIGFEREKINKESENSCAKSKKGAKNNKFFAVVTGIAAGFLNGLFGGGGGMVVVPMLTGLLKLDQKTAHATALLVILPLSLISFVFYLSFGKLEISCATPIVLGVISGGIIGAFLLKKLSAKKVAAIFYLAMLASGIKMLFF